MQKKEVQKGKKDRKENKAQSPKGKRWSPVLMPCFVKCSLLSKHGFAPKWGDVQIAPVSYRTSSTFGAENKKKGKIQFSRRCGRKVRKKRIRKNKKK